MSKLNSTMELLAGLIFLGMVQLHAVLGYVKQACQDTTLSIGCPNGKIIFITSANYGRTDSTTCPNGSTANTSCYAMSSVGILMMQCYGKTSCKIDATNGVFGDPCAGTSKYLQVEYDCVRNTETRAQICENSSGTLTCPTGSKMEIRYGNYGRTEVGVCPVDPRPNTTCHNNVYTNIKASCEGNNACTLSASTQQYGDPCSGTTKYLDVGYRCVFMEVICEKSSTTIACPTGQALYITYGTYGRQDNTTCLNPNLGTANNKNCNTFNGYKVPSSRCNGLNSCKISATDTFYKEDPCPDTSKYATVSYSCSTWSQLDEVVVE